MIPGRAAKAWGCILPEANKWLTHEYVCLGGPTRFKAAWCSVWELEPVPEVFGEVDVVADSLVDMADKIIKAAGN